MFHTFLCIIQLHHVHGDISMSKHSTHLLGFQLLGYMINMRTLLVFQCSPKVIKVVIIGSNKHDCFSLSTKETTNYHICPHLFWTYGFRFVHRCVVTSKYDKAVFWTRKGEIFHTQHKHWLQMFYVRTFLVTQTVQCLWSLIDLNKPLDGYRFSSLLVNPSLSD